jgi:UDP-glucose 4-epimerase
MFNAYGPSQSLPAAHAPVIPRFIRSALSGASLVAFGAGAQTRDYVYINDAVSAMVTAATASGVDRQVINIGSGIETSVRDLINTIGAVIQKPVEAIYNSTESGGVSRMCADISRAKALLGYEPRVTLEEGLRRTIELDVRFKT